MKHCKGALGLSFPLKMMSGWKDNARSKPDRWKVDIAGAFILLPESFVILSLMVKKGRVVESMEKARQNMMYLILPHGKVCHSLPEKRPSYLIKKVMSYWKIRTWFKTRQMKVDNSKSKGFIPSYNTKVPAILFWEEYFTSRQKPDGFKFDIAASNSPSSISSQITTPHKNPTDADRHSGNRQTLSP